MICVGVGIVNFQPHWKANVEIMCQILSFLHH